MYRVSDNLYLKVQLVNQATYKNFILRYMVDGKRLDRSLGSTSKITLRQAREKAQELMASMVAGEGVPSQVHTVSLDYFGARNDFWQLKLGVIDNDSNIDGRPTAFTYETGYNVELFNVRNWRNYRLETQLTLGKSVFDRSYQHLSVSLFWR